MMQDACRDKGRDDASIPLRYFSSISTATAGSLVLPGERERERERVASMHNIRCQSQHKLPVCFATKPMCRQKRYDPRQQQK
jgi:hypothetical protein